MKEETIKKVDAVFAEWAKNDSPGCSLAIVQDNEIVYSQGYGMANLEYMIPNKPDTIFHIASVSKQFACFAILLLEAEGKLSIEDDYRKHLPQMPDFGHKVTIRHLMHHTSGIRDQWELLQLAGWRMDDVITTADIEYLLKRQTDLNFKPGDRYTYCNSGYTLLGLIVKAVSGKTLREFCQEKIFTPLGMTRTHFHDDHTMLVPGRSYSYGKGRNGGFVHEVLSYANAGATSLFTTVEDLAKWNNNFDKPVVGNRRIINKMLKTKPLNDGTPNTYALGLMIGSYRRLPTVEHSGADAGYRTQFIRFPEQKLAVIVFCNLGTMMPGLLARLVADVVLEGKFKDTKPAQAEAEPKKKKVNLKRFAGVYYDAYEGISRKFIVNDDKLALDLSTPFDFEPSAERRFKLKAFPMLEIEFSEKLDELWFVPKPGNNTHKRVKAAPLSDETQAALPGTYYSPELDVNFQVTEEKGSLYLHRLKYAPLPLVHAHGTNFICDLSVGELLPFTQEIQFIMTSDQTCDGFLLNSGRVKNVRFTKK